MHSTRPRQAGFSLIELVVAITIMTIIVGAAVPMTSKIINSTARRATKGELTGLSDAAAEFFTDTGTLPAAIDDLIVDSGVAGWTGPYLPGITTDDISGLTSYEVDGWSRAYQVAIAGDIWTCTSAGGDASQGTADDISVVLDVTRIRRNVTLERLTVINQSITKYNADWMGVSDLPTTSYTDVFNQLWGTGYLPNNNEYRYDGWGTEFQIGAGSPPVVAADSANL